MNEDYAFYNQLSAINRIDQAGLILDKLITTVNSLTDNVIEGFKISDDKFIYAEKASKLFDLFIEKLMQCRSSSDYELSFYAATLIVNFGISDNESEDILVNAIGASDLHKSFISTTILCRLKSKRAKRAILAKLKDDSLVPKVRSFFESKLNDIE